MGLFNPQSTVVAFRALLDREKAFILKGDLEGVFKLAREKERLMTRLARSRVEPEVLNSLRYRAERNNRLLDASARGFQAVKEHLERLQESPSRLKTYGSDGQRADLGKGAGGFNKRA